MSDFNAIEPFIVPIITAIFGLGIGLSRDWLKVKRIIKAVRVFVDDVDDAVYDDKVTETEFRKSFDSARNVVKAVIEK